ncbi:MULTISPECIES: CgeB family protein [Chelativorans]|jgi:spore maturation protein CgeB|uniref:Spore protein YkvP/CgeB glycosyl transferase-like domain-containing protein n=1 Tax=Chelativorans sp. (strain BNC1) TaxID=266779 RepID=Q11EM4_CHESB|nr:MULTISPECIES: glycosyltransferase [Chelativorans]
MSRPLSIVILGLTLSSSWGNGHATTYRALLRGLHSEGHKVLFLERDVPWYAESRDLPNPDFCRLAYYNAVSDLDRYIPALRNADAVVIGSYVPDGAAVINRVAAMQPRLLCFYDIDTPVTLAALQRGKEEFLTLRQVPLFDIYFSFSGGGVLDRLESEFGARRAEALYCSVDEDAYGPTGEDARWDLGYLGTYSPDRQPVLERLLIEPARRLPEKRFVVAGAQYPSDIAWPENVELITHLPPEAHASFYSRQRFTLNVTRADMVAAGWSPSVRVFEAGACAAPIISDRWRGIEEIFRDGESILLADESDQVVSILTGMAEAERDAIGRAARERVLDSHTGRVRARQLAGILREAGNAVLAKAV